VAGISVNGDWINGYARTVEQAGDDLTQALRSLRGTPLAGAAFGELGRTLGAADAYAKASSGLQGQVDRAVGVLKSAADQLRRIADSHVSLDERQARLIRQVHPE
jgi:hypothetical protein